MKMNKTFFLKLRESFFSPSRILYSVTSTLMTFNIIIIKKKLHPIIILYFNNNIKIMLLWLKKDNYNKSNRSFQVNIFRDRDMASEWVRLYKLYNIFIIVIRQYTPNAVLVLKNVCCIIYIFFYQIIL